MGYSFGKLNAVYAGATHTWVEESVTWSEAMDFLESFTIDGKNAAERVRQSIHQCNSDLNFRINRINDKITGIYQDLEEDQSTITSWFFDFFTDGDYSENMEAIARQRIENLQEQKRNLEELLDASSEFEKKTKLKVL